jgi:hypothetical protein
MADAAEVTALVLALYSEEVSGCECGGWNRLSAPLQASEDHRTIAAKRLVAVQASDACWRLAMGLLSSSEPSVVLWAASALSLKAQRDWTAIPLEGRPPALKALHSAYVEACRSLVAPAVTHILARALAMAAMRTPDGPTHIVGALLADLHSDGSLVRVHSVFQGVAHVFEASGGVAPASLRRELQGALCAGPVAAVVSAAGATLAVHTASLTAAEVASLEPLFLALQECASIVPGCPIEGMVVVAPSLLSSVASLVRRSPASLLGAVAQFLLAALRNVEDRHSESLARPMADIVEAAASLIAPGSSRETATAAAAIVGVVVERMEVLAHTAPDTLTRMMVHMGTAVSCPFPSAATAVVDAVASLARGGLNEGRRGWMRDALTALLRRLLDRLEYKTIIVASPADGVLSAVRLDLRKQWDGTDGPPWPAPSGSAEDWYYLRSESRECLSELAASLKPSRFLEGLLVMAEGAEWSRMEVLLYASVCCVGNGHSVAPADLDSVVSVGRLSARALGASLDERRFVGPPCVARTACMALQASLTSLTETVRGASLAPAQAASLASLVHESLTSLLRALRRPPLFAEALDRLSTDETVDAEEATSLLEDDGVDGGAIGATQAAAQCLRSLLCSSLVPSVAPASLRDVVPVVVALVTQTATGTDIRAPSCVLEWLSLAVGGALCGMRLVGSDAASLASAVAPLAAAGERCLAAASLPPSTKLTITLSLLRSWTSILESFAGCALRLLASPSDVAESLAGVGVMVLNAALATVGGFAASEELGRVGLRAVESVAEACDPGLVGDAKRLGAVLKACHVVLTAHGSSDGLRVAATVIERLASLAPGDAAVVGFLGDVIPRLVEGRASLVSKPSLAAAAARLILCAFRLMPSTIIRSPLFPDLLRVSAHCCRARSNATERIGQWSAATLHLLLCAAPPPPEIAANHATIWETLQSVGPELIGEVTASLADPAVLASYSQRAELLGMLVLALGSRGGASLSDALAREAAAAVSEATAAAGPTFSSDAAARVWGGLASDAGRGRMLGIVKGLLELSGREAGVGGPPFPLSRGWLRQLSSALAVIGKVLRGTETADALLALEMELTALNSAEEIE